MIIGRKAFSAGSVIRYEIDYQYWLAEGRTLSPTGFTATVIPDPVTDVIPADVVVDQVDVTSDRLFFFVTATSVNEMFTVEVTVMDTLGETVIDTVEFNVIPK